MPTFEELAQQCIDDDTSKLVDTKLLYSLIGHVEIEEMSSSDYQNCLSELYDKAKIRGVMLSAYARFIKKVFEHALSNEHINEIPELKTRAQTLPAQYNKPDEAAMKRLLTYEAISPAATIIHLAWYCGLLRNEIVSLRWKQVDLDKSQINLPHRSIPLVPEVHSYLRELARESYNSEYVLVSSRKTAPVGEQNASVIARRALDQFGLDTVRLNDLRTDYVINLLLNNDIEYVSYLSGIAVEVLRAHYLPHIRPAGVRWGAKAPLSQNTRAAISELINKEPLSISSLAIRLVWDTGMTVSKLTTLTWDDISSRDISKELMEILQQARIERDSGSELVFLNQVGKPLDAIYIGKVVQQQLISNGIFGVSLSTLRNHYLENQKQIPPTQPLLEYLHENGGATKSKIMSGLGIDEETCSNLLARCRREKQIICVGMKYFLPGTVISEEEQREVIVNYVRQHQPVSSAQLIELLGLAERKDIYRVLKPLIKSGILRRLVRDEYYLV